MAVSLLLRSGHNHDHGRFATAFNSVWDKLGVFASGLCLLDCLVLPLLSTALMGFASSSAWAQDLHWLLLPIIGVTAGMAFYHSYKAHRSYVIVTVGLVGYILLIAGEILEGKSGASGINWISLAGSLALISAHLRNLWMHAGKRKHKCEDHEHSAQVP